jgi:hypothetical protein
LESHSRSPFLKKDVCCKKTHGNEEAVPTKGEGSDLDENGVHKKNLAIQIYFGNNMVKFSGIC